MIGIIHASRGRIGNRALELETVENVKKYLKEKYYDFGLLFALFCRLQLF